MSQLKENSHNPNNWLADVRDGRDEMRLYEWTNGDIQTIPSKYIVHKAIDSWEYGQFNLVYGEDNNTYEVALKSTRNGQPQCNAPELQFNFYTSPNASK